MKTKKGIGTIVVRLLKIMREFYPVMVPATVVCIIFNAIVSSFPSVFMQNIIAIVEDSWQSGDWAQAGPQILTYVAILASFYILSLVAGILYQQMMAVITQGTLKKLRVKMFNGM